MKFLAWYTTVLTISTTIYSLFNADTLAPAIMWGVAGYYCAVKLMDMYQENK
jgi:uncharacterized MnhB-related membrane protein